MTIKGQFWFEMLYHGSAVHFSRLTISRLKKKKLISEELRSNEGCFFSLQTTIDHEYIQN